MKLTLQSPSLREQQSQTYMHRSWRLTISAGAPGAAVSAAEPTHRNESVSFIRTAAALAWRAKLARPTSLWSKVICSGVRWALHRYSNRSDPASISGYSLSLPASTEISVNAHQTQELIQLSLSKSQLCIKIIGFVRQHLQIACGAASITHLRKPGRVLRGKRELLLLPSELLIFTVFN